MSDYKSAVDEIVTYGGIPIDRMAWRVIQPGEHYERGKYIRELCFDEAPPIIDRDFSDEAEKIPPQDLRGLRVDRLTVVAYWGKRRQDGGSRNQMWVCRCLCGLFTIRRARSIVSNANTGKKFMCDVCDIENRAKAIGITPKEMAAFVKKDRSIVSKARGEEIHQMLISAFNGDQP